MPTIRGRSTLVAAIAIAGAVAACGGPGGGPGGVRGARARPTGDREVSLTLFRDAALVHERWRVPLANGRGAISVPLDAGVSIDDVAVVSTQGARLVGLALRAPGPEPGDQITVDGGTGELVLADARQVALMNAADRTLHVTDAHGVLEYKGDHDGRAHAAITLDGAGAEAWIELTYRTPRIAWSAAYALIRDAHGNRATLEGAVAIENRSGVDFPGAAVTVVDNTFEAARTRSASELAKRLLGSDKADPKDHGRALGVVDVSRGQTRLAVTAAPRGLALKEVLVFDPIGTKLNAIGATPQKARDYGLDGPRPETTVLRSFEIQLDPRARSGLPAGPVRLFGRGEHGELAPLGAGRLFDRAQSEAKSATVPVGRSPDVKGRRQRTDFYIDEKGVEVVDGKTRRTRRTLVEEFTIVLTNSGGEPARVLVREHLYRGETWKLAYHSPPRSAVTQEGEQQFAMRVDVPAGGETRVRYRVVYTW